MDPPNGNERKFLCLYLVAIGKEGGGGEAKNTGHGDI